MLYKFLRWCPGAVGLLLRQKLYPGYVKECGSNVLFGRFVDFGNDSKAISIGSGVVFNDFVTISTGGNFHNLVIGDKVFIGTGTRINVNNGNITIQPGSNIGSDCVIQSDKPVLIENNVLVAAYCEIGKMNKLGDDSEINRVSLKKNAENMTIIRQGCWLGVRAKIAAGKQIGAGTIIGAHSMVSSDITDHVVAIGNPAEVLRKRA